MDQFLTFYTNINFILTLLISEYVSALALPKRKYWYVALPVSVIALVVFSYFFITYVVFTEMWLLPLLYLIVFLTSFAFIVSVYRIDFWSSIVISTFGYACQHIAYQIHSGILALIDVDARSFLGMLILSLTLALTLLAVYFLVVRKMKKGRVIEINNRIQVTLSLGVVLAADFLSLYGIIFSSDSANALIVKIILILFSILACVFGICLEYACIKFKEDEKDLALLRQMVHSAKKQLELGRENIDIINIKCHDLKHQINALTSVDEAERKKINDAIDFYDNDFHTQNDALDVVLTEKSLLCKSEEIRLTCLINAEPLKKVSESDIYSFFGNAIDNAREALVSLPKEKKSISITSYEVGKHYVVRIENYCSDVIAFEDGLPQTKKNTKYHGFGTKSMKIIAEKYHGNIRFDVRNEIFTVTTVLPLNC